MAGKKFTLTVPLDLTEVPEAKGSVKVAVIGPGYKPKIKTVNVNKKAEVTFDFDDIPRGGMIHLAPATASDEDLEKVQTIKTALLPSLFAGKNSFTAATIKLSAADWYWWLSWCRTFTIHGRVVCPDGVSPVPGATVCAYDVDWFWWWRSRQQIQCATTNEFGVFAMTFTWCCGWLPWYWWKLRTWDLDLDLAKRLQRLLPVELRDLAHPQPIPQPDLRYIESLTSGLQFGVGGIKPNVAQPSFDPKTPMDLLLAETVRKRLVERLTPSELKIWPWFPWNPWTDCNPDLIFRVTQPCGPGGAEVVIVDEGFADTRWNVGTTTSVTLQANELACCERPVPCEGVDCIELTHACGIPRASIGGNDAAHTAPAGYAHPITLTPPATLPDRPFSDTVTITGTTDCLAHLDYYEFEFFDGTSFVPMPSGAMSGFARSYFTTGPFTWHFNIPFSPTLIDGHLVYETRQHYEATHASTSPFHWMDNRDLLGVWQTGPSATSLTWADGTYRIRIKGYNDAAGGHLAPVDLPPCDPRDPRNELILTLDNRLVGTAFHPLTHPCGTGTVHVCTREPDTDIVAVRIYRNGITPEAIVPCERYEYGPNDEVEIDFYAYDPDGHLAGWTLDATFGLNEISHLTSLAAAPALSALPGVPGIPAAPQLASSYRDAVTAGATSPTWGGGAYRLRLNRDQTHAMFPKPCCYQLELRASKRTIVSCTATTAHENLTEYSFMLG